MKWRPATKELWSHRGSCRSFFSAAADLQAVGLARTCSAVGLARTCSTGDGNRAPTPLSCKGLVGRLVPAQAFGVGDRRAPMEKVLANHQLDGGRHFGVGAEAGLQAVCLAGTCFG